MYEFFVYNTHGRINYLPNKFTIVLYDPDFLWHFSKRYFPEPLFLKRNEKNEYGRQIRDIMVFLCSDE